MPTKKEEGLLVLRRSAEESSLWVSQKVPQMGHVLMFLASDAGVLEHGGCDGEDALLGSGHGWMASPAGYPAAKMVPPGHRTGGYERVRPGYTYSEHAHHHVLLLPKQVGCQKKSP